ncbi:MAG: hypothetical protein SNJ29_15480, partial [Rikenellaceae bacterium]
VAATNVVMKVQNALITEAIIQKKLAAAAGITLSNAEAMAAARATLLSAAQYRLVVALKAVKVAMLSNPWTAALVGITAVVSAIVWFRDRTGDATEEVTGLTKAIADANAEFDKEASKVEALQSIVVNGNVAYADRKKALDELKGIIPGYNADLTTEGILVDNNTAAIERYLRAFREKIYLQAAEDDLAQAYINRRQAEQEIADKIAKGFSAYAGGSLSAGNMSYTTVQYSEAEADQMRKDYLKSYDDQIEKLNNEIAERSNKIESGESPIYGEIYEHANKQWDIAKTALEEIESDRHNFTQKQYDDAIEAEKNARQAFERLGGETSNVNNKETKGSGTEQSEIEEQYQSDRLASLKAAMDAELELEKSKITDQIKLIESERDAQIEAIEKHKLAYQQIYEDGDTSGFDRQIKAIGLQADADIESLNKDNIKAQEERNEQLLKEFETYEQERERIAKEYVEKIAAMYVDEAQTTLKVGFDQGNVDNAIDEMNSTLLNLDINGLELVKTAMGDVGKMSRDTLTTSLNTLRDALAETTDPEQIKIFRDQIIAIEDALTKDFSSGFTTDIESVIRSYQTVLEYDKKIAAAREEGSGATEEEIALYESYRANALEDVKSGLFGAGITTFVSGLQQSAELMKEIANISGDTELAEMGEQLGAISQNLSAAGQGAASGGWIGAIVGGVTDMISQTIEGFATAALEAAEAEANALAFASALELINLTINEDDYDTTFGTASISKATDAYAAAQEAQAKYNETISAMASAVGEVENAYASLGAALFSGGILGLWETESNESLAALEAYNKGYSELQSILVKTADYSGWDNFWGKQDEYTALADLAPEIWQEGIFNIENAQAFLETNTQLSDAQRELIQNAIDLGTAYEEAIAIVDSYTSDLFGNFASDLSDVIWDSVVNGTDAWDGFYSVGSEAISSLGKQMLQEMIMSEYLEEYRDKMREAFATEDPAAALADITNDIISGMGTVIDGTTAAAQAWVDGMISEGYTPSGSSTDQSGNSGSFETMSQDQGTKLEGLFTAAEIHLDSIDDNVFEMKDDIEEVAAQMSAATGYLKTIAENTGESKDTLKTLYDVIKKMISDGLKIK